MEHPLSSSMAKKAVSSAEESGWTSYFEDFSNAREPSSCFSHSPGGSSLLSDAASCAAWKSSHPNPLPKKLTFKKSRTKQISEDDPLEDTASSPVNSPKVGELHPAEMISRKVEDQQDASTSMGRGFRGAEHYSESEIDEDKREVNLKEKSTIDCTDLKKRGLCLVPLSMLVNYFG